MRIAIGGIEHETNTFADGITPLEDFLHSSGHPDLLTGDEIRTVLSGTQMDTGGFLKAAEDLGFKIVPLIWTFAQPSPTVAQEAYEYLAKLLLRMLSDAMPVDGVLLDLHGAMVTEELEDVEGDLIQRVRRMVGPETPIMVTLDLHANITPLMAEQATALIGYDTYPHIDCAERGYEAAAMIQSTVDGRVAPTMAFRQVDMLIGPPKQCTLLSPMKDVLEYVHELERRPGVLSVTASGGFPFADIHDAGASVVAITDGDAQLAEDIAEELATYLWERRAEFEVELADVDEVVAATIRAGKGPVILADGSDNPGGGAPCDGTEMLRALVDAKAPNSAVVAIADPEAVAAAIEAGVGNEVTLTVGGKTDNRHGAPLALTGYVRMISDGRYVNQGPMHTGIKVNRGRTVVFVVGDVEVILVERRTQPYDMQAMRSVGIEPSEKLMIGLKSAVHFRADYGPVATTVYDLDTPGVHSPNLYKYDYKRVRRPIWPLDK